MSVFTAHLAEIAVSVAFLAFWEFLSSPLAFCFCYFEPFEKKVYQLQQFSLENEEKNRVFAEFAFLFWLTCGSTQ